MRKLNILSEVKDAGRSRFKKPGELYLPQLQVGHILRCIGHQFYSDNEGVRLRRHTLLYGPTGAVKTTICNKFLTDYIGASDVAIPTPAAAKGLVPSYLNLGGRGMTWERLRGGCTTEGRFIPPLLMEPDYYMAGELFSFLGHQPSQQAERMDVLNEVLEEGRVTVSLVKMFNMKDAARVALEEDLDGRDGVYFNSEHAILSYDVGASLIGASRFFTPKQQELLSQSGFLSRLSVVPWFPSDSEDAEYRRNQFGPEDPAQTSRIRNWNMKAWRYEFDEVPSPPESMVDDVMGHYHETYTRIREETGLRIEQIGNTRDTIDIKQLLTAHAATRVLEERIAADDKSAIPTLEYIDMDGEWVKAFSQPKLNALYDTLLGRNEMDPKLSEARDILVEFVARQDGEYPNIIEGTPFTEFYHKTARVSIQTARRRLRTLKERGFIQPSGRLGIYTVSAPVMAEAGHVARDLIDTDAL